MNEHVDLLIIGAGPAGMSAAVTARSYGLRVLVVDEQTSPGGQIWRNIESLSGTHRISKLGKAYQDGVDVVEKFRASGARYEPRTQVWQLETGPRAYATQDGIARSIDADYMLLATGAQERPVPFPGWTLPGVMTVGAGQILLKSSNQIPKDPVWIAGNGPLPLLYASQLLEAGGRIAGFLDTSLPGQAAKTLPLLAAAIGSAPGDMLKGLKWLLALKKQVLFEGHVKEIEALGSDGALRAIRYVAADGKSYTAAAKILLVHEGIVPTIHPTLALGCRHVWNEDQDSFAPELDEWGETSEQRVYVAGDGGGIGGASAACLRGEITAIGIALKAGFVSSQEALKVSDGLRQRLKKVLRPRPFLDKFYRPRPSVFVPSDDTIACRCEEVTVATIKEQMASGSRPGPNQVKAFTRAGMGPCQGRQCGYTIARVLASQEGRSIPDVGLYRIRPPLKPLTLQELAALDSGEALP